MTHLPTTAPLITSKQIKKMILSYLGTNKGLQDAYLSGEIEIELCPQGTIAERLRAAGAGMPGFFTRTGAGTDVETGGIPQKWSKPDADGKQTIAIPGVKKDTQVFDGKSSSSSLPFTVMSLFSELGRLTRPVTVSSGVSPLLVKMSIIS